MDTITKPIATLKTTNESKYDLELQPKKTTIKTRKKLLLKPKPTVKPKR